MLFVINTSMIIIRYLVYIIVKSIIYIKIYVILVNSLNPNSLIYIYIIINIITTTL